MNQFKIGDRIQLNSGGPVMTVKEVKSNDDVVCNWLDKSTLKEATFKAAMLHLFKPGPGILVG